MLKRASLGYDGLLADIYWTRAVQYFGDRHYMLRDNYNLLAPLLEITTQLDPHLVVAYEFGSSFLRPPRPTARANPSARLSLMEYGIRNNPDDWRLYYDLGFVYYTELKDYAKAAEAFARGSQRSERASLHESAGGPDGAACRGLRNGAHVVEGDARNQPATKDPAECHRPPALDSGGRRRHQLQAAVTRLAREPDDCRSACQELARRNSFRAFPSIPTAIPTK